MNPNLTQVSKPTQWKAGVSGNPNGRPVGTRQAFSAAFYRDLAEVWAAHGKDAMLNTAKTQPATFLGNWRSHNGATVPKQRMRSDHYNEKPAKRPRLSQILQKGLMINRLPAKPSSKCRPLLFWCCWVLVNPGFSESGLCNILFIQNLIFFRLFL